VYIAQDLSDFLIEPEPFQLAFNVLKDHLLLAFVDSEWL
jgi:hypothetical protein